MIFNFYHKKSSGEKQAIVLTTKINYTILLYISLVRLNIIQNESGKRTYIFFLKLYYQTQSPAIFMWIMQIYYPWAKTTQQILWNVIRFGKNRMYTPAVVRNLNYWLALSLIKKGRHLKHIFGCDVFISTMFSLSKT